MVKFTFDNKQTSTDVSRRSAAATRVSIFKAAPNPVVYEDRVPNRMIFSNYCYP
jgi:hypothetical protein